MIDSVQLLNGLKCKKNCFSLFSISMMNKRLRRSPRSSAGEISINDLPTDVLILILSFLPIHTAFLATTLSRAWRNLWKSLTIINIDCYPERPWHPDYFKFIGEALSHRNSWKIQKLRAEYSHEYQGIKPWVDRALTSGVEELTLVYRGHPLERPGYLGYKNNILYYYATLYFDDLLNSSVKVLAMHNFKLGLSEGDITRSLEFDSIREIHLHDGLCSGEVIQRLVAASINLKTLSLHCIRRLWDLNIESNTLERFDFYGGSTGRETLVKIRAPRLKLFNFYGFGPIQCAFNGPSSLVEADVWFPTRGWNHFTSWTTVLHSLSKVERLSIQNMWTWTLEEYAAANFVKARRPKGESYETEDYDGKVNLEEAIYSNIFIFYNLKHLELLTGYLRDDILGLEVVLKKCPLLETMVLVHKYKSDLDKQRLRRMKIDFQMPCLRVVTMKNYGGTANELYVLHLLEKHGKVLEKIVAFPTKGGISRPPQVLYVR